MTQPPSTGLARVAMGVHYLADILAGMLTGILVALLVLEVSPAVFSFIAMFSPLPLW